MLRLKSIDRLFMFFKIARSVYCSIYCSDDIRQQTFRYRLIPFIPSSYHEDVISIIAVIGASESCTRPTASARYVSASLRRYE
jgi:hypothetical protein